LDLDGFVTRFEEPVARESGESVCASVNVTCLCGCESVCVVCRAEESRLVKLDEEVGKMAPTGAGRVCRCGNYHLAIDGDCSSSLQGSSFAGMCPLVIAPIRQGRRKTA
jgi:hypothetical protein